MVQSSAAVPSCAGRQRLSGLLLRMSGPAFETQWVVWLQAGTRYAEGFRRLSFRA